MISSQFDSWIEPVSGVVVHKITNGLRPTIHRFYDTSPISPSGRYIALTEFPFEDRLPAPGDQARVFVLELSTAREIYSTFTAAWDTQVGAHVQWGASDEQLFFNRMDTAHWQPYGVKVDIQTNAEVRLEHSIYMISPDGLRSLSPCLKRIGLSQPGYGVITPADSVTRNVGISADDGLYSVDTSTGRSDLLISIAELFDSARLTHLIRHLRGSLYGFHVKWNSTGDRVMFIVRFVPDSERANTTKSYLFTLNPNGGDVALALTPEQWEGGHHPNWCPDGRSVVMNLIYPRPADWRISAFRIVSLLTRKLGIKYFPRARRLSFVLFDGYGGNFRHAAQGVTGSGHPTIDPSGRLLISDAYLNEEVAFEDGIVPIRGVDLATGTESYLMRVNTEPKFTGSRNEYRIDPHPAWDRSGRYVTINASVNGCRSVFIVDLADVLERL